MKLKKHDFIEVEYTGKLEDGVVFDTTDEKTAKAAGITREAQTFGPVTICLGESHILKGIDDYLIGKEIGEYSILLEPENAFGKKNAKLLKLIPSKVFVKEKIAPYTGLEVNIDNSYGIVRSVSGGRVIVDFNHPLSGRVLNYNLKVLKEVTDTLEKAKAVFKNELNLKPKLELNEGNLIVDETIPEQLIDAIKKRITELIPDIKDISLKKKEEKKEEKPKAETKE